MVSESPDAARESSAPAAAAPAPAPEEVHEAQVFLAVLQGRRPVVTWALLAAILAVFGLENLWGGGSTATLVRMGAQVPQRIRDGEWWRLLAPTFLHSGFPHIVMNGLVLWMLGPFIERLLGSARFLVLYVLCGLLGSVFGMLFSGFSKFGLSVGASGALFGLLGASAVLGLWPRGQIPALIVRDLKKTALINLALNVFASVRPNVDYLAHLGGLVAGVVLVGIGLLQPTVWAALGERPRSAVRELLMRILAALCLVALVGSLGTALVRGQPWLLVRPLKFARQALSGTGLSIDAPSLLGQAQVVKRDDGATEASFGTGLESPVSLAVVISPFDAPIEDPAGVRRVYEQAVQSLRSFSPGPDTTRLGEPQELEVQGLPALAMRYRYAKSGAVLQRLFQVRARYVVALESLGAPDLPKNLQLDLEQVLDSLRDDEKNRRE